MAIVRQEDPDAPMAVAWILRRQGLHPLNHLAVRHQLPAAIVRRRSRH
jgi:hypothetical protein